MKKPILSLFLAVSVLLCACAAPEEPMTLSTTGPAETAAVPTENQAEATPETTGQTFPAPTITASSDYFTDRDLAGTYDKSKAAYITLEGSGASCTSNAVQIDGGTVTILDEGTYVLSGSLADGMIIVSTDKQNKVQLVLDGVSITSANSAPIYVRQADKVFVTLAPGTENILTNGGSFEAIDENNIDAVIFSKEDLTLNGSGSLTVNSPAGHGVVSKDELTLAGGCYEINTASHGLSGKDNVCIAAGDITIISGKDGIQAENEEDATLGFIRIEGGSFQITCEGDGISASGTLDILEGDFTILAGGGYVNGEQRTSENWGMGGGPGGPGGRGGFGGPGGQKPPGENTEAESEDSTSIKGIKASGDLTVSGGSFAIDTADDAVHSNANVTITGGSFEIATGDDGFHADANLSILGGSANISTSYEGLEGQTIDFGGGNFTMDCTDDGLNAAGGTDQSGFGGRGGDMFSADPNCFINITGGTIYLNASGDGIDSNGDLTVSGGHVTVCGPTQGDTAVLDFGGNGTISGGTFIGTGAYMMAQVLAPTAKQGVFAVSVGNQAANTAITLADGEGKTVISVTPELPFAIVILSSPDIIRGETYTITVGGVSGSFEAQ